MAKQKLTKLFAAWATIGGREVGMKRIQEVAQKHDWHEALGIDAIGNRVVWSHDDEGITVYYREAA